MKSLLQELELNVESEIVVQKGIQGLLDEQLEILLRGGAGKLTALLARAEDGLDRSRALERERGALIARIGAKLGVPSNEVSLKLIEERLGAEAAKLSGKGAELKALIERIRDRNREVGLLLRHSVLFIEDLIRAVTGTASAAPTYTRDGAIQPPRVGTLAAEA